MVGGATATETFSYTLRDADGDESTAQLTLNIRNDDDVVTITDLTPTAQGGDVTLNEDDLLATRGAGESAGSDASKESTTQGGTFTISAPDGVQSLTVGGLNVISNGVFAAVSGSTLLGNTLAITGYDAPTGTVTYTYTLNDNEAHAPGSGKNSLFEDLTVSLTDRDGDNSTGSLSVNIIDDVPTAVVDSNAGTASETNVTLSGNLISNDILGADGAAVVGASLIGTYGSIVINADGSYTYTLNAADSDFVALGGGGTATDPFTYSLRDADGDESTAQLTLNIRNEDAPPEISDLTPAAQGGDVTLNEDDLLSSRGVGKSAGSDVTKESTTQVGTFKISAPDGVQTLTVGELTVISGGVFASVSGSTSLGNTLSITGYDASTGTVTYSYSLLDNESHALGLGANSLFEDWTVTLTDRDGDSISGTLSVNIVDDVPTAVADVDSVTEDGATIATGNVITAVDITVGSDTNATDGVADTRGADGASVTGVRAGTVSASTELIGGVATSVAGAYGALVLRPDGTYQYTLDNSLAVVQGLNSGQTLTDTFSYTLKDGDGDISTTTLAVTVNGVNEARSVGLISTATGYQQTSAGDPQFLISEGDIMQIDLAKQSISGFEYLDESYTGPAAASVPASTPVLFGKIQNIDAMHLLADGKLVFSLPNTRELETSTYKVLLDDTNLDLWVYNPQASGNKISAYGQFNALNQDDFKAANVDALHILDTGVLLSFGQPGSIRNATGAITSYQENDIVFWNGSTASVVLDGASYFQTNPGETATDKGNIDSLHISEFNATGGLKIVDGLYIRSMVISTQDPFVVKLSSGWTTQFSYGDLVKVVFNNNGSVLSANSIYLEDANGLNTGNPKNIDAYTEKQVVGSGPIAIDLDHSGVVDYLSSSESAIVWDFGAGLSTSGWIAPADGLLIYDYNSDGLVLEAREFVLTRWGDDPSVSTDLQALVAYFDTNKDDVFDARDDDWTDFRIWQDIDANGISELGEVNYLADYGITSFNLTYDLDSQSSTEANGDVYVYGQISVIYADGSVGLADDMEFIAGSAIADQVDIPSLASSYLDTMAKHVDVSGGGVADQSLGSAELAYRLDHVISDFIDHNGFSDGDYASIHQDVIDHLAHGINEITPVQGGDLAFNDQGHVTDDAAVLAALDQHFQHLVDHHGNFDAVIYPDLSNVDLPAY